MNNLKITHGKTMRLFPLICGLFTFFVVYISAATWGFPVKFSLCYFFFIACVIVLTMYGGMALKARSQGKFSKYHKILMACMLCVCLLVGWTFATLVLRTFNKSSVVVQSLIVSGLGIWKCIVMQFIKICSKMVKHSGERYAAIERSSLPSERGVRTPAGATIRHIRLDYSKSERKRGTKRRVLQRLVASLLVSVVRSLCPSFAPCVRRSLLICFAHRSIRSCLRSARCYRSYN